MRQLIDKAEGLLDGKISIVREVKSSTYQVEKVPFIANGHKLWELNCETGICDEAEIATNVAYFPTNKKRKQKQSDAKLFYMKPHCFYYAALNEENAIKKHSKKIGVKHEVNKDKD